MLDLAEHLPTEAAEALLELAVGKYPQPSLPAASGADPFDHPDALRRFRVMHDMWRNWPSALEYPWEQWIVFLHPEQQAMVERHYNGSARVSGSAGTGKTVVALHRAAYLARVNPSARVLLTTFSDALARLLQTKLGLLVNHDEAILKRITVASLDCCRVWGPLRHAIWRIPNWHNGAMLKDSSAKRSSGEGAISPRHFYTRNGIEWLMAGSWIPGRITAVSGDLAATAGCRNRSAKPCGRYSNGSSRG